jgi:hypothetical protein
MNGLRGRRKKRTKRRNWRIRWKRRKRDTVKLRSTAD